MDSSETFWIDLAIRNPLDTEINLSNLTVTAQETTSTDLTSAMAHVDIEIIDDIILGAKETRTVSLQWYFPFEISAYITPDTHFDHIIVPWVLDHHSCDL